MSRSQTLLLVHGAWHGSWCWEPLEAVLSERGWDVRTIDLPTVHAQNKGDLDLHDDARAVAEAIADIDGEVVVVAHSYGGVPVTEGAVDPRVTHIVYIAAFVLDAGESLLGAVGGVAPDWWHVDGPLTTAGDDVQTPQHLFFGDVDPATADTAAARLTSQATKPFTDEVTRVAWRGRPTTYIVTERDVIFPLEAQLALAGRSESEVVRLDTSHSPFLSQPVAVADVIDRVTSA